MMCGKSLVLWFYSFPLIISFSIFWPRPPTTTLWRPTPTSWRPTTTSSRPTTTSSRPTTTSSRPTTTSSRPTTTSWRFPHKIKSTTDLHQLKSTTSSYNDKQDIAKYNLNDNFTKDNSDVYQYDTYINLKSNNLKDDDKIQYEFQAHENDNQTLIDSLKNSTEFNSNKNVTSQENHESEKMKGSINSIDLFKYFNTSNIKNNVISYKNEKCNTITCIQLCCPFSNRLFNENYITQEDNFTFLRNMYEYNSSQNESKGVDELLLLVVHNPCQKTGHYSLNLIYDTFLANGSLHLSNTTINSTSYCLVNVTQNKFTVNVCSDIINITDKSMENDKKKYAITCNIIFSCGKLGIMLMMFLVYSKVSDVRNIHGFILRRYSGLIFVAYTVQLLNILIKNTTSEDFVCKTNILVVFICYLSACIKYYSFLGSYFWLNIMSFDIWHTFRQFSSQRIVKQQKKKLIYSVYGWGVPFMLVIICGIHIYFSPVESNKFQLKFNERCWIPNSISYWLYYYGIIIISITSNVGLSFFTKRNITRYEKDIVCRLEKSEKQRYNVKKQWRKLQLKVTKVLFIIICFKMGLNINMYFVDENNTYYTIRYTFFALNVMQYFCIFVIFVWKRKY